MARSLTQRVWFTLGALAVWRLGSHIPLPGIDYRELFLSIVFEDLRLLLYPGLLTGGGLGDLSVFTLGLVPYFAALSIVLLLSQFWHPWKALREAGEAGRRKLTQYIRIATFLIAIIHSIALALAVARFGDGVVVEPGLMFLLTVMSTLTAGAIFLIWLGEQITRFGVGNGMLLIVGSGIVAEVPVSLATAIGQVRIKALEEGVLWIILIASVAIVAASVLLFRASRDVIVQYPKRIDGNKIFGGRSTRMKIGLGGYAVYVPLMAVAAPTWFLQVFLLSNWVSFGSIGLVWEILIWVLYLVLLVGFGLAVIFARVDPDEIANNLKSEGGFVPGIRPGKNTAEHLRYMIWRLGLVAAICLGILCLVPDLVFIRTFGLPPAIGGTGLVIMTYIILSLMQQRRRRTPGNLGPPDIFGPAVGKRPSSIDWEEGDIDPSELFPERQRRRRAHARTP